MQGTGKQTWQRVEKGIRARHARTCRSASGGKCNCDPTYEASVYDPRSSRELGKPVKVRQTFDDLGAAKGWLVDAAHEVKHGKRRHEPRQRLTDALEEWLTKCEQGERLSPRTRRPYAPATLRDYRSDLSRFVTPLIGHLYVTDVTREHVEKIIEDMNGRALAGSTIRNAITPLQAFYRYKRLPVDPTANLDLPEPGQARERVETPAGAEILLHRLSGVTRDIFAAAFYSGLRRGELMALRVQDVKADRISVVHNWDQVEGLKEPKSKAGKRDVPIIEPLREILDRRCEGRPSEAYVFGTDAVPFSPNTLRDDALKQWAKDPALNPITLHGCRHTFITWLDTAGISEARADRYAGHANTSVQRRYRHQLDGQLAEDAATLTAYIEGAKSGKVVTLAS